MGTIESRLSLDVRQLARAGALEDGRAATWRWSWSDGTRSSVGLRTNDLTLVVSFEGNGVPHREAIELTKQHCHFGGSRTWFRCPPCGRRVARLSYSNGRFLCRKCAHLVYRSQRADLTTRGWWKIRRAYRALGLDPDVAEKMGSLPKPRGMHWSTFSMHCRRIELGVQMCDAWLMYPSKSLLRLIGR